jgi:hypothetical protein
MDKTIIRQYLPNNNEKSYSAILQKKFDPNRPLVTEKAVCRVHQSSRSFMYMEYIYTIIYKCVRDARNQHVNILRSAVYTQRKLRQRKARTANQFRQR